MSLIDYSKIFLPAIITIVGNIIFYIIIKNRVDKSLEQYKISYSGIFKEKTEIYKRLLEKSYDIRLKIQKYQFEKPKTITQATNDIFIELESFKRFYMINRLFLSETILNNSIQLNDELSSCFNDFHRLEILQKENEIIKMEADDAFEKFRIASNKLYSKNPDNPFLILEHNIISEIKNEWKLNT